MLLIPGPVQLDEETMLRTGSQMVSHRSEDFRKVLRTMDTGLREILGTTEPVYTITGSGTAAVEFLAANTIARGDNVLCLSNGKFGNRFADIARVYSDNVICRETKWGFPIGIGAVDDAPAPDIVTMVANETSTGVLNDVSEVRRKFPGAMLLVDAVSALGNPLSVEGSGIDGIATASQKALASPPGLAFASLNKIAQAKAQDASIRAPYYLRYEAYCKSAQKGETPFTPCIPVAFACAYRIGKINEEGIGSFIERHGQNAAYARKRIVDSGFQLFPKGGAKPSSVLTAVETPNASSIVQRMREKGFVISGGQDALKGKIFRMAHMGVATRDDLKAALDALESCIS